MNFFVNNLLSLLRRAIILSALLTTAWLIPIHHSVAQDKSEESFTVNLDNVDIPTLIEMVSERTGKNFIVDPRVRATVNVVSSEPVNAEKFYDMFLSVLEINGFAAVPAGNFIKIVPTQTGVQSAIPLQDNQVKENGELVSRVIRLEGISAVQVVEALRPLIPASASLSAEVTSNSIVATDSVANIEKLVELIQLMANP